MQSDNLKIAYYVTGHGLGHSTRVVEVCKYLLEAGHSLTINTVSPHEFFLRHLPTERLSLRSMLLDCGAFQLDAFTVDMKKSLEEYHRIAGENRDVKLASEAEWLRAEGFDLVVSDIVPLACAAACSAGAPSVCVSNFSWDFVYSDYLTSVGSRFRKLVWQIAEDYSQADLLLRLPGHCPMPAFREIIDVPLVARKAQKSSLQVRQELGIAEDVKLLVFMYGGQPPGDWELKADSLPSGWVCIVCSGGKLPGGKQLPSNFLLADKDAYTPDLIGASTCILGKIGYGSVSEALVHGKPFVFIRRDFFNEEPFLRKQLEVHGLAVEIKRRDFLQGNWQAFLQHAATLKSSYKQPTNGAEAVAELLEDLAYEKKGAAKKKDADLQRKNSLAARRTSKSEGSTRLRDAVVYGYIMQRHGRQEKVEVPEWYTRGLLPASQTSTSQGGTSSVGPTGAKGNLRFEVLEGDAGVLEECEDSREFLSLVAKLDERPDTPEAASLELPEHRSARGLFRFEDDIWVARAPGRLDVMGGIADYSGSLVLQMPIAQACHVAAQVHPRGATLKLWHHIRDRHAAAGEESVPVIRIVSLKADSTNRGHAFDMDLRELKRDGLPLSYADARRYFQADPSQSWAAYVAGALLVLMHEERECSFDHGLSLLISSDVPDGKGVSSSAALEVASMTAISAAYGIQLAPSRLATLCQQVENLVVGAPCGIMDQMASVLGQRDSLLALRCQPAEMLPVVHIPAGLKFWGIDSGLRHSVGGQDYGSVRTAAFMGLKMLSAIDEEIQRAKSQDHQDFISKGPVKQPKPIGASYYLCNIAPSEYRQFYEEWLPISLKGRCFLEDYGEHWDATTEVNPSMDYPVLQATTHPIEENFRVESFRAALLIPPEALPGRQGRILGELMFQSHASYGRCGLGSEATDRLVALTREEIDRDKASGKEPALFGAKITGGGSGGTVCILGRNDSEGEEALARVVAAYSKETGGFAPVRFVGSSMGAAAFGRLRIRLDSAGHVLCPTMSAIEV